VGVREEGGWGGDLGDLAEEVEEAEAEEVDAAVAEREVLAADVGMEVEEVE